MEGKTCAAINYFYYCLHYVYYYCYHYVNVAVLGVVVVSGHNDIHGMFAVAAAAAAIHDEVDVVVVGGVDH